MSKKRKIQMTKKQLIKECNSNINYHIKESNKWANHYINQLDTTTTMAIHLENMKMERDYFKHSKREALKTLIGLR